MRVEAVEGWSQGAELEMWDQPVLIGVRTSPRMDANIWTRALREHCDHEDFHLEDFPMERLVGFACSCRGDGDEDAWTMPLTELRRQHRDVLNFFEAVRARQMAPGTVWHERRLQRQSAHMANMLRAERRASVLLRRSLTAEQRRELRQRKAFHVTAADGRRYRIENGSAHNVVLVDADGDAIRYCIVFKDHEGLPNADLMLAQKLLLETNPAAFLRTARFQDLRRPDTTCAVVIEEVRARPEVRAALREPGPQHVLRRRAG